MRICSDALPFALPPALVAAVALAAGQTWLAAAAALVAAGVAAFFRDPERHSSAPADQVISPADGRVLFVRSEDDGLRIAIFLSVFNVHVARAPIGGHLSSSMRLPGGYAAAYHDRASRNARVEMDIETPGGTVHLGLMAGLVARRVLPWVSAPASLQRGQRIAIIRFGSRAELLLPASYEALVHKGDRVRAGETALARPSNRGGIT